MLFVDDLLVAFNAEVVGDTNRANRWIRRLDGVQERSQRIWTNVLVVQDGAGRVDVRIPAMPQGTPFVFNTK